MADTVPSAERMIKGLQQLLTAGGLTEERLRQSIATYPELLDSRFDAIIQATVSFQSTDVARRAMKEVADLLAAVRFQGVDAGIAHYKRELANKNRERRVEQARSAARQRRRDRERARTERPVIREDQRSLSETVQAIRDRYPAGEIELNSKPTDRRDADSSFRGLWPRLLFRGESSFYPTTTSSLARLRTWASIPLRGIEDILRLTIGVRLAFEEELEMPRLLAEGFLQHYGYPTDFLDVTADLAVAASFASELGVGDSGVICVLPTELLQGHSVLVDLRSHDYAERPRRQHALALSQFPNGDLKHPDTVRALGLEWWPFQFKEEDDGFIADPMLLDGHSDAVSGLAQFVLSEYGKIEDSAARWLADRIQPAPMIGVTVRGDDGALRIRLLPADEAGAEPVDEARGRQINYESWSERYPAPEPRALPPELLTSVDALKLGATVHLMRSRALGLAARKRKG